MSSHLAIDLGAESGRVLLGRLSGGRLSLTEVRRFPNVPVTAGATLRWDVQALWREIQRGIAETRDAIASLGVDVTPKLTVVKLSAPPPRKAGIKVPDVASLVQKLKSEAKVI